jgi:hypothetical protein
MSFSKNRFALLGNMLVTMIKRLRRRPSASRSDDADAEFPMGYFDT